MIKKLLNNSNKNQLTVLADQALVSGVNFLMAILLARFLGLEQFGLFVFGWMLVLFASSIQLAFIISPLFTLYPKHQNKTRYVAAAHTLQILFSLATFVVSFAIVKVVFMYQPNWQNDGLAISLPLVAALFVLQDFYRRVNFTDKKPVRSLISDTISYGMQPLAVIGLHYFDLLTINTTCLIMSTLFMISILYNALKVKWTLNTISLKNTISENWSFSKYLVGTSLLQWVSGNFFIIIAGGVLGPVAIGAIRIAQNIVGVLHVVFSAMENSMPIKAAEILAERGTLATISYFKKMFVKGGIFTLSILIVIAIARKPIVTLFYGVEALESIQLLLGYTGLYVLVFLGTILGFVIRTFEMNKIFFWSYIATTLFSLLSAKIFVTEMGIYGVLLGLFITQLINISCYVLTLNSKFKTVWK